MNKKLKLGLIIVSVIMFIPFLMLSIFGCIEMQRQVIGNEAIPNYTINQENSASVGSVMLSRDSYKVVKQETWAGTGIYATSPYKTDHFREELIYAGIAGDVIKISYREYIGRDSLARPSFFQELSYDLKGSSIIVFKNFRIEVLGANNEGIKFVVLKD